MLSKAAFHIIQNYLQLPFPGKEVSCPYFINKKNKIRGALRALVGKGTPDDIVEEAQIAALKEKINLANLDSATLRKFLVDHCIGIDCSGLVYHIVDTELKHTNRGNFAHFLTFRARNFFKKIVIKLRPAENTNVVVLADEKNSTTITLRDIKPSDLIILKNVGPQHSYQHVVFVHEVDYIKGEPLAIHYTHSIELPNENSTEHGIRQGKILINDINKPLLEQNWEEREKINAENKFFNYAKTAESITIHRLRCFI